VRLLILIDLVNEAQPAIIVQSFFNDAALNHAQTMFPDFRKYWAGPGQWMSQKQRLVRGGK